MRKLFIYNCLTLLFAVITTLSFTACGGSDGDDTDYAAIAAMQGALGGGANEPLIPYSRAVDLGLSVKWANCNVGAEYPWEYGGYYAWGETKEKYSFDDFALWSTYKYCNGSHDSMTKYCTSSNYGRVDNKTTLEPTDDVATVKWGGAWRMPTRAEQDELRNKCTWEWTTLNGIKGYRVTGPNGNYIFLPAAGGPGAAGFYEGNYWSSSLSSSRSSAADYIIFRYDGFYNIIDWDDNGRNNAQSVRPVCK